MKRLALFFVCMIAGACLVAAPQEKEELGHQSQALTFTTVVLHPTGDYTIQFGPHCASNPSVPHSCLAGTNCVDGDNCSGNPGARTTPFYNCVKDMPAVHDNYIGLGAALPFGSGCYGMILFTFEHLSAAVCGSLSYVNYVEVIATPDAAVHDASPPTFPTAGPGAQVLYGIWTSNNGVAGSDAAAWMAAPIMMSPGTETPNFWTRNPSTGGVWAKANFCTAANPIVSGIYVAYPSTIDLDGIALVVQYAH